jgi:hypothetical protein
LVVTVVCLVIGFCFGWWPAAETVHEAAVVVPGHPCGGDRFDVGEPVQWAGAEW